MSIKQDIQDAFNILNKVRNVSSTKAKQEELSKGKDNSVLKTLLILTYSPQVQYYIKKLPLKLNLSKDDISEKNYALFLNMLTSFKNRTLTGNAASDALQEFLMGCNEQECEWYSRVIQRDIKCGIADKNINKVFGDIIPIYDVLLADKFEQEDVGLDTDKAYKILPNEFIVEPKLDGMRLNIWVFDDGRVELYSRNGKMIYGYDSLAKDAEKLPKGYVYDGELMSVEFEKTLEKAKSGKKVEQPESDCYQDLMTSAFAKTDNKEGIYNLFDRIPIDEFKMKKASEPLKERKHWIQSNLLPINFDCIKVVEWSRLMHKDIIKDREKAVSLMKYFLSIGYEGAMVKDWNSVYEFKRSKSLLKMKFMDLIDLVVTDVYEGESGSKYSGMLGGVTCDYEGYPLGVGSGWSDSERTYYWEHPEEIVGKTISISYQNKSENLDGGKSLRFPVKKFIRYDK